MKRRHIATTGGVASPSPGDLPPRVGSGRPVRTRTARHRRLAFFNSPAGPLAPVCQSDFVHFSTDIHGTSVLGACPSIRTGLPTRVWGGHFSYRRLRAVARSHRSAWRLTALGWASLAGRRSHRQGAKTAKAWNEAFRGTPDEFRSSAASRRSPERVTTRTALGGPGILAVQFVPANTVGACPGMRTGLPTHSCGEGAESESCHGWHDSDKLLDPRLSSRYSQVSSPSDPIVCRTPPIDFPIQLHPYKKCVFGARSESLSS